MRDLPRLFCPESVAVIGGGAWCASVIEQLNKAGYNGTVWHVHPKHGDVSTVVELPTAPDAAFIGINREGTIEAVKDLNQIGAGGAVCFASGFSEVADGQEYNAALLAAAGSMPILGPNCYGFINALDGALLWPDQHGCQRVNSGVAILTQSSNIAINLTMQQRGLEIAYVVTCGNQAQTSQAEIAAALLGDERVTAIGLHIEGFGDLSQWQALARKAAERSIPLVALKIGASQEAQTAAVSHTASLAGDDAGAQALLDHLGIARLHDLPTFMETLKLLHINGPLSSTKIATISCSGGEASLSADMGQARGLTFPPLCERQSQRLFTALGPKVTLANPLDYHTYIWRDTDAMADAFSAMVDPDLAMTLLVVDFPRNDLCDDSDWDCAVNAALIARKRTGAVIAMAATLPELMPEHRAHQLAAGGVIPFNGLAEAFGAIVAAQRQKPEDRDILPPGDVRVSSLVHEHQAKRELSAAGLNVPEGICGDLATIHSWAESRSGPFALKATGLAHKSDSGGVILNLSGNDVAAAAKRIQTDTLLLEEMVQNGVELLLGIVRDPAHGFILTIGSGGVLTEIMEDAVSLHITSSRDTVRRRLMSLRIAPLLSGYRGQPPVNIDAILDAVEVLVRYVTKNANTLDEIEINPLICTDTQAVAADVLIRRAHDASHQN